MQYIVSFLEGIITFISPCLIPMLPIYISYFAGGEETRTTARTVKNALGFVLGFTIIFVILGALAGTVGKILNEHKTIVNIISGSIVAFLGLNFLGIIKINLFKGMNKSVDTLNLDFISSVIFGITFAIGWSPCVGTFLGSALMLASQRAHLLEGMLMLLVYSLGLGIPFLISAVLIDYLKSTFDIIKKNYKTINLLSGISLVTLGLLMATGLFNKLIGILS